MKTCLITPTRNRPVSFELLERWVGRQRGASVDQWIVVNDGQLKYRYTQDQLVVHRKTGPNEGHSLPLNLLEALPLVETDVEVIFVAEDDDWWAPDYMQQHLELHRDGTLLVGNKPSRHYNVATRRFRVFQKPWCNLGSTSFRRELLGAFEDVCSVQAENKTFNVDVAFWGKHGKVAGVPLGNGIPAQHVGLKGMPGEPGLGMGHKLNYGTLDYQGMEVLRQWIGEEDWKVYRQIVAGAFNV